MAITPEVLGHPSNPKRVLGPYEMSSKDGRKIVILMYEDGRRKTTAFARYLMECHLGRVLDPRDEVDHINQDCSDDRLENLQVLPTAVHRRKGHKEAEWYHFDCPACGIAARKPMGRVRHNWKLGKVGPYCSRRCAGKMHH